VILSDFHLSLIERLTFFLESVLLVAAYEIFRFAFSFVASFSW
jgi:hypothetical protein